MASFRWRGLWPATLPAYWLFKPAYLGFTIAAEQLANSSATGTNRGKEKLNDFPGQSIYLFSPIIAVLLEFFQQLTPTLVEGVIGSTALLKWLRISVDRQESVLSSYNAFRKVSFRRICRAAGPSKTINMDGNIKKASGNSIFNGA